MCCWLYEPYSKSSFKFCSNKLDSPCPTTQNSLRLAALPRKNKKNRWELRARRSQSNDCRTSYTIGFLAKAMFLPFDGWLFRGN